MFPNKGPVTTAHSLIEETTTSEVINCKGFNAVMVYAAVTVAAKNWTTKIQGAMESSDTFVDWYDGSTAMSFQTDATHAVIWKGIPDFIKVACTEDVNGGKLTVKVQPINVS